MYFPFLYFKYILLIKLLKSYYVTFLVEGFDSLLITCSFTNTLKKKIHPHVT